VKTITIQLEDAQFVAIERLKREMEGQVMAGQLSTTAFARGLLLFGLAVANRPNPPLAARARWASIKKGAK